MKKIKLTKGKWAIVDDEDFEWLSQWKWHYANVGYAARSWNETGKTHETRKHGIIFMHRLINKTRKGLITDHINRKKLDNRRCNLRETTQTTNIINSGIRKDNKSGIKGVYWSKQKKKWCAKAYNMNKQIHIGFFKSIESANVARINWEKKYYATI